MSKEIPADVSVWEKNTERWRRVLARARSFPPNLVSACDQEVVAAVPPGIPRVIQERVVA